MEAAAEQQQDGTSFPAREIDAMSIPAEANTITITNDKVVANVINIASCVPQKRKASHPSDSNTIQPTETPTSRGRQCRRGGKSALDLSPVVQQQQYKQQRFLREYKSRQQEPPFELKRSESSSSIDYSKTMLWADDDEDEQRAETENTVQTKKVRTIQSHRRYCRRGAQEYGDMIKSAMEVALLGTNEQPPGQYTQYCSGHLYWSLAHL